MKRSLTYERIREGSTLPTPTGVALAILRMASTEDTRIERMAAVVETDPAISARLLQFVNSPLAGMTRPTSSVSMAVRLLGMRTVKILALGFSLVSTHRSGRCEGFDYEGFWSDALARAVGSRALAQHLRAPDPDEAFTVGLLSKIGRLALATAFPEAYTHALQLIDQMSAEEGLSIERDIFEIDHNTLASEMMADWGLPDGIVRAVRLQGETDTGPAGDKPAAEPLARILHLAGAMANVLTAECVGESALQNLVRRAGALGLRSDGFPALFDGIREQWRQAGAVFAIPTRDVPPLAGIFAQAQARRTALIEEAARTPDAQHAWRPQAHVPRAMIVDDDPDSIRLLKGHLVAEGYEVLTASDGQEGLRKLLSESAPLLITDWMMPGMSGVELCRAVRGHPEIDFTYIIVLTGRTGEDCIVEAFDAGADDYLVKPFSQRELRARLRAADRIIRLTEDLRKRDHETHCFNAKLALVNSRLMTVNAKLKCVATTDDLTGLLNRRAALSRLTELWAASDRHGWTLSCIAVDLDHFKTINDTHGHAAGDLLLKSVAGVLRNSGRTEDVVCRMGGDEFLILCPEATAGTAQAAAERRRKAVEDDRIRFAGLEFMTTATFGVAQRMPDHASIDDLLKAADEALYAGKRAGANCVSVAASKRSPRTSVCR